MFSGLPYPLKVAALVVLLGAVIYFLFKRVLKKSFQSLKPALKNIVVPVELLYGPLRMLMPVAGFLVLRPFLSIPVRVRDPLMHVLAIWFIIGVSWLVMRIIALLKAVTLSRYRVDVKDNLKARQISTQLNVIQRVLVVLIFVVAASAILMTFPRVRQVGVSILASAGIAGVIIGFAAQRSLATLIAGIQIAITQPIRIDDVVIVEGEWGWIEEITLTYVVVRIWDQRRLVVPITYFIEKPFQNWTRTTAELLGTIYIYADYGIPIDELRGELDRIVADSPLWDKRVANIQVTNTTDKTVELRALISAENSSNAWDLRCLVREKLLAFMQVNYPESLPCVRLETRQSDGPPKMRRKSV